MTDDGSLPTTAAEWRAIIEAMPQIVWITRPDGWHLHFNQQWMDFTGRTLEESLGHGWNPAFHPEDRARAWTRWQQATSTGEPYEIEYRLRRFDGVYRWMLGRATPLRDASGRITTWMGTCTDVEELKRTQAELEERRALQRIAGRTARVGGWIVDVAAHRVTWSDQMYDIYDLPPQADVDLDDALDRYLPEHRPQVDAAMAACMTDGTPFDLELALTTYQGLHRWVRAIGEAQRADDGQITHLVGALQDISRRKEISLENEVLAERLTTTLESITDGFFTLDREWRFTYLNEAAARLLRRGRDDLLGKVFWSELPDVEGTDAETAYRRAMEAHEPVVLEDYHYPPLGGWFEVHIDPSAQGITVNFRDVSEQHRARVSLTERMKELQAQATISRAAHRATDPAELADLAARSLVVAMQHPGRMTVRIRLGEVAAEAGEGRPGPPTFTAPIDEGTGAPGRIVVHDASGEPLLREEETLIQAIAETLGLWRGRHLAAAALEQANEELNAANDQLGAAARLKDDLLSMASHELRTPLTPIIGFLETIQSRGDNLTSEQEKLLRVVRSNAQRMLRLVDDLLVVSRATAQVLASHPEDVLLESVVTPVLDELREVVVAVETAIDGCQLHVDPQQLQQILINLLTNAAKYGEPPLAVTAVPVAAGRVAVEVADRGPGVPADFRERMWDRFEQKDRGDTRTAVGAGLGLSIVRLLAEANGGEVRYRDGDPGGAVFVVELRGEIHREGGIAPGTPSPQPSAGR